MKHFITVNKKYDKESTVVERSVMYDWAGGRVEGLS